MALADLEEVHRSINDDSPRAAALMVRRIREAAQMLVEFPALGRPGRVRTTRELVVDGTPYVLPYRVGEAEIVILRVYHGARKWPSRL